jgi:hypothetical protein
LIKPRSERGRSPARTLQGIREDHQRFLTEGKGNIKKAKLFNNVISEHFFDIAVEEVLYVHVIHT